MRQYNCPDCKRPPTDSCYKCERIKEGHRYKYTHPSDINYESNPCTHCSNNPANGGSGICHCILNVPKIT